MKKFTTTLIASLCLMGTAQAQDSGQNYVMKRMMLNTSATSYIDNIQYYDGLGRPFQSVERAYMGGTQTGSILATLQEYDTMGRESNTWLPIGITGSYLAPAAFRSNAPGSYGSDARPYSQSVYESSPLDRLTENYRPGSAWSTKPARVEYAVNTTASPYNCIRYSVSSADAPVSNGNYAKGTLRVTKATDEDGKVLYTFTDKQGQTLLERRTNGTETLDTYYVYDDYGCLRFVLQPEYQTTANLDLYAFQYKYDNHNNCIWKKLPGAQYVTYEYDSADRMIFSQDGVQRAAGKWTFYVYDSLDRLTQQGEHTSKAVSSSGVYLQNYYDNYTSLQRIMRVRTDEMPFHRNDLLPEAHTLFDTPLAALFPNTTAIVIASIPEKDNLPGALSYVEQHYTDSTLKKKVMEGIATRYVNRYDYAQGYEQGLECLQQAIAQYELEPQHATNFAKRRCTVPGQPFPTGIVLKDREGRTVDFATFKGKYVYIDMWASWCVPCLREVPVLQQLEKKLKNKKVEFVSISIDASEEAWKNKLVEKNMHGHQLWNPGSTLGEALGVRGIPFFAIYDPDGNLYMHGAPRPSQGAGLVELLEGLK